MTQVVIPLMLRVDLGMMRVIHADYLADCAFDGDVPEFPTPESWQESYIEGIIETELQGLNQGYTVERMPIDQLRAHLASKR